MDNTTDREFNQEELFSENASQALVNNGFDVNLLALASIRGVGPQTLRYFIEYFHDLNGVWNTSFDEIYAILERWKVKDKRQIAKQIAYESNELISLAAKQVDTLRRREIYVIGHDSVYFPSQLKSIDSAPLWLFVEGNLAALQEPLIAVVGTRKPSKLAIANTKKITSTIAREGFGIVSGLAEGIDACAHLTALYFQAPQVAVLGTGIDIYFPSSSTNIRRQIIETGGAVITEYFLGDSYSRSNFVQRNRIQAALALAVTAVESQAQSGTAHTVRFAESFNKPLFGVMRSNINHENEILGILEANGHPTFDISTEVGVEAFKTWLQTIVPSELWPRKQRELNAKWFLKDVLQNVDDILSQTPVSNSVLDWFSEQIAKRKR